MTKPSPEQPQREDVTDERATYSGKGFSRRVSVNGMPEIDATVVVMVVQGKVWMSIMPPLPGKPLWNRERLMR